MQLIATQAQTQACIKMEAAAAVIRHAQDEKVRQELFAEEELSKLCRPRRRVADASSSATTAAAANVKLAAELAATQAALAENQHAFARAVVTPRVRTCVHAGVETACS